MCYGAGVDIDPGALKDFFLLQMPVRGHETIVAGAHTVHSTPTMASMVSPSLAFHMRHGAGTEKPFLRINREMRWGFMHLGQFSAAYRRRFGLLPSQTWAATDRS